MLFMLPKCFYFYTNVCDTPLDIKANLLALISKGKKNLVLLFELNTLERIFRRLLVGFLISLQIVFIAFISLSSLP